MVATGDHRGGCRGWGASAHPSGTAQRRSLWSVPQYAERQLDAMSRDGRRIGPTRHAGMYTHARISNVTSVE
jgi:hypothetical protein